MSLLNLYGAPRIPTSVFVVAQPLTTESSCVHKCEPLSDRVGAKELVNLALIFFARSLQRGTIGERNSNLRCYTVLGLDACVIAEGQYMNLQEIEAFVAVAETGSVSRAAMRLNLTQPAMSRRIQSFETTVGDGMLFNRTVKPAVLTTLGAHVLEHCRRVLEAVAELERCTTIAGELAGNLNIGIAHGLGEVVLSGPLDALRKHYPCLRLQINSNWSVGLIEDVRSGVIDCAIALLTDEHMIPADLQSIDLGAEEVVIVSASRRSVKQDGSPWRMKDLANEDWFLNPLGCGCRVALTRAFDRQKIPMRIAAEIFGEDLQLSLLSESGGLALVPRGLFDHSLYRQGRHILSVRDFNMPASVVLIRRAAHCRFDLAFELLTSTLRKRIESAAISA